MDYRVVALSILCTSRVMGMQQSEPSAPPLPPESEHIAKGILKNPTAARVKIRPGCSAHPHFGRPTLTLTSAWFDDPDDSSPSTPPALPPLEGSSLSHSDGSSSSPRTGRRSEFTRVLDYAHHHGIFIWRDDLDDAKLMRTILKRELAQLKKKNGGTYARVKNLLPREDLTKEVSSLTISLFRLAAQGLQRWVERLGEQVEEQEEKLEDTDNEVMIRDRALKQCRQLIEEHRKALAKQKKENGLLREEYVLHLENCENPPTNCSVFSCFRKRAITKADDSTVNTVDLTLRNSDESEQAVDLEASKSRPRAGGKQGRVPQPPPSSPSSPSPIASKK